MTELMLPDRAMAKNPMAKAVSSTPATAMTLPLPTAARSARAHRLTSSSSSL